MLNFFWASLAIDSYDYSRYDLSNVELVKYATLHLGRDTPFALRSFRDAHVSDSPDDILIGHPTFDHPAFGTPTDAGADWVTNNALEPGAPAHPNTYILTPWTTRWGEIETRPLPFFRRQLAAARRVFGICGSYWADLTMALDDDSVAASVKSKFVHLNMGCAAHALPRRVAFPSRPRRTFLHISNLDYYKRTDVLFSSVAGTDAKLIVASAGLPPGDCRLHIVGHEVAFRSLGRISNSNDNFNRFVLEECDFYIHTSDGDAQATTILEACARGLVPLVTPQSGFACEYALELSLDSEANRAVIERAMTMPDSEYQMRSLGVRRHIEQHHSWDEFYGRIRDEIARERRERVSR